MSLKRRLERLREPHPPFVPIRLYLYDLDGETVTGPDGERLSVAEAERRQQGPGLVIDLRGKP